MAVIGITDGSEVTVSEPSRTVNVEELEQIATASYGSSTVKDYEQLANKPSIEGVTLVGDTELSEIGAAAADHTHSLESLGAASADHTHSLESLGAAAADHSHTLESLGAAAANHGHSLESLGAAAANHTHTPASIGAAEADHTHTPESIGAAAASHTHAASSITGLGSAALMDDDDFDAAGAAAAVLGTAQDDAGDATVYGALASAAAVEDALVHHTHTPAEIGAAPAVHTHTPASIGAAAESHEHDAADITSGVLDDELIPNLDASKITSGTFDGGRLPTVPITRTALGAAAANHTHTAADVGAADAVHSHAAEDITSGTLASDRLPTVPVAKGGTGSTTAANARTALGITPANIGALPTALGGTVAGTINLMSNNIDRDGANPSSDAVGRLYQIVDKDNERIGFLRATQATDGSIFLALAAFAESTGGVEQSNWLTLRAAKDGSNTVIVTEPSAWRSGLGITPANIGAVNKAGDTMTGSLIETGVNLYVDTPTLDPTDTEATTYQSGFGVVMRDKDRKNAGVVRAIRNTVRSTGLNIFGQRIVNGTNITNQLSLLVREDGSLAVDVSDRKVWAEMLGCTAAVISKNSSWTTTFSGSSCLVTISRGSYYAVGIIDYWSTSMNVIMQSSGVQTAGLPTITKSANSYSFTITNDHNSVSIAVDVISIPARSV